MAASPQKEDGFVQLALDLFAAIMTADLSNAEMIVLAEVLLHTYSRFKRRSVHLDPIALEHYTGLHRNNVRAAIKGLVAAGIIKVTEDGSHRFVKDYESWTVKARPFPGRLDGGLLRFAKAARGRFGRIHKSKKDAIQPDCVRSHPRNPTGLRPEPSPQSNRIASGASDAIQPDCGAYKVRAAEELRRENDEKGDGGFTPTPPAGGAADDPAPIDPGETNPGPGTGSPEADALATWAESLGGNWSYWARSQCASYPAEWVRALLERHVLGASPQPRQLYLASILQRWKREGKCDLIGQAPAAGPAAAPSRHAEKSRRTSDLIRAAAADLKAGGGS